MLDDVFTITLIVIIVSSILVIFIKRKQKDRCLKDFNRDIVSLIFTNGERKKGKLYVTGNGIGLYYSDDNKTLNGVWGEFIYKPELPNVNYILRSVNEISNSKQKKRRRRIKHIYKSSFFMMIVRGFQNFFKAIRDSFVDISGLLMGRTIQNANLSTALKSQNKYVTQVNEQLAGSIEAAYEPLLENSMGKRVLAEIKVGENSIKITGLLKEYTSAFVELMNIKFLGKDNGQTEQDIIFPRAVGVVRYLAEKQ